MFWFFWHAFLWLDALPNANYFTVWTRCFFHGTNNIYEEGDRVKGTKCFQDKELNPQPYDCCLTTRSYTYLYFLILTLCPLPPSLNMYMYMHVHIHTYSFICKPHIPPHIHTDICTHTHTHNLMHINIIVPRTMHTYVSTCS